MASSNPYCSGCNQNIAENDCAMTCAKCHGKYDLVCAGFSEDKFDSLTVDFVKSWICVCCRSKLPKACDLTTPIRLLLNDSLDAGPKNGANDSVVNISLEGSRNVTHRKKASVPQHNRPLLNRNLQCDCGGIDKIRAIIRDELRVFFNDEFREFAGKDVISPLDGLVREHGKILSSIKDGIAVLHSKMSHLEVLLEGSTGEPAREVRSGNYEETAANVNAKARNTRRTTNKSSSPKNPLAVVAAAADTVAATTAAAAANEAATTIAAASDIVTANGASVTNPRLWPAEVESITSAAFGVPLETSDETLSRSRRATDALQNETSWTEVVRRKNTRPSTKPEGRNGPRASLSGVLKGTAAPDSTLLRAADRKSYLHLYYVQSGTTVEQVLVHLNSVCGGEVCSVDALKARGDYASFKLGIPKRLHDRVMSPSTWAEGIHIKPWRTNFFRTKQEATTKAK